MKTSRNFNRKPVKATTKSDLLKRIKESELRGWKLAGKIVQHTNGFWFAVMEKERRNAI